MGRLCVGAWEELGDTCEVAREESCYSPVDNWGGTSDALCECGEIGTMPPPPPPPPHLGSASSRCDEDIFPDLDKDQSTGYPGVCGECKLLVTNFASTYESSCITYCGSMGRLCVGAWEENGDTCEVAREESCYSPANNWGGTSDAICECGDLGTMPPPPPPPPHLGSASSLCDETKFP